MRKNKTQQCEQEIRVWVKAGPVCFCSLRGILYTWMCCVTACSVLIFLPHVMQCEYSWRLCRHVSSNPSLFPLSFRVPVPESTRADLIDKRMQWRRRAEVVCDADLMPRCRTETAAWLLAVKHTAAVQLLYGKCYHLYPGFYHINYSIMEKNCTAATVVYCISKSFQCPKHHGSTIVLFGDFSQWRNRKKIKPSWKLTDTFNINKSLLLLFVLLCRSDPDRIILNLIWEVTKTVNQ